MAERIRFDLTATDKTKRAFAGVKRGLAGMRKSVLSLKGAFVGLLSVAAVGAIFRKLMGAALPFNRAIAETSTLIEGNKQQLDFLRDTARKMASEFGGTGATQVKAFYQAISAGGGTVEQAAKLIDVANKLAIGGVGSLTDSVRVLTTSLNNYGKAGLTAQAAADILFTGVKFGETTIGALGAAIGRTASLASDAGVKFTELVAATAALTTGGITTKEAITGIRAILAAVIKPTEEARKMAAKLKLSFNATALATDGLAKFLDKLMTATGGNVEQMAQLFGGMEALGPIIALVGSRAELFSEAVDAMTDAGGAMEDAYLKVARSLEQRLVVQMGKFGVASEIAGSAILTVLVPALELVTSNLKLLGGALAFLIATQIPLAIRLFVALAKTIMGIGVAAGTAGTALALLGGPLGIILGVGALVIIFFDDLKSALERLFPSMTKADSLWGRFIATMRDGNKVIREFLGLSFEGELATKIARLRAIQDTLSVRAGGGPAAFATMSAGSTKDLNAEQDRLLARIRELGEQKISLEAAAAAAAAATTTTTTTTTTDTTSGFSFGKALDLLDREAAALDFRATLVGKNTRAIATMNAERQIELRLIQANLKLTPEQSRAIKQFADDVGFSAEMLEKSTLAFEATNKVIADQKAALEQANAKVKQIGESFIEMALRGEASFKTMVDTILSEFIRMETRILSSALFGDRGGGGGLFGDVLFSVGRAVAGALGGSAAPGSSPIPVPRPSAKGDVFAGGNVVPFARGGIVNSPTIFPMKSGIGLLGEAGPEAILPLKRGPGGKLGVEATVAMQGPDPSGDGGIFGKLLSSVGGFLGSQSSGSGSTGLPPAIIPGQSSAKGNVFAASDVVPFARGGIVNSPTIFPMKNGIGLLGEAGPEAILPLKRGPGGKLGVEATIAMQGSDPGGGGNKVEVHIHTPPGSDVQQEQRNAGGVDQLHVFIDNATAQNLSRPGSATFRALATTHGTRQQLVRR